MTTTDARGRAAERTPLCRNGLHPASLRVPNGRGRNQCGPCRKARGKFRQAVLPGGRDGWADPVADAAARTRFVAWSAGLDAAIAEIRLHEGIDGRWLAWQALGEPLDLTPIRLERDGRGTLRVVGLDERRVAS